MKKTVVIFIDFILLFVIEKNQVELIKILNLYISKRLINPSFRFVYRNFVVKKLSIT